VDISVTDKIKIHSPALALEPIGSYALATSEICRVPARIENSQKINQSGLISGGTRAKDVTVDILREAGGFHKFTQWEKPLLTDSGGYQVFSLAKLRKISEEGVKFQSHIDGSPQMFTPESVIEAQQIIGSDIMMPLDDCIEYPATFEMAKISMERTTQWAQRSKKYYNN